MQADHLCRCESVPLRVCGPSSNSQQIANPPSSRAMSQGLVHSFRLASCFADYSQMFCWRFAKPEALNQTRLLKIQMPYVSTLASLSRLSWQAESGTSVCYSDSSGSTWQHLQFWKVSCARANTQAETRRLRAAWRLAATGF